MQWRTDGHICVRVSMTGVSCAKLSLSLSLSLLLLGLGGLGGLDLLSPLELEGSESLFDMLYCYCCD